MQPNPVKKDWLDHLLVGLAWLAWLTLGGIALAVACSQVHGRTW